MASVCESVCVHTSLIKTLPDCASLYSLSPLQVARGKAPLAYWSYLLSDMSGQIHSDLLCFHSRAQEASVQSTV